MDEILNGILKDFEMGIKLTVKLYKKTNQIAIIDSTITELQGAHEVIENVEFRSYVKRMIDGLNELKSVQG